MLLAKHLAPRMPAAGSFVLFSGSSAQKPLIGMLAVAATNGAYDALGEENKAALFAQRSATSPARRIGTPDDIAGAVVFALTGPFLTGVALSVDGGEPLV
jgi:hypothetical protein